MKTLHLSSSEQRIVPRNRIFFTRLLCLMIHVYAHTVSTCSISSWSLIGQMCACVEEMTRSDLVLQRLRNFQWKVNTIVSRLWMDLVTCGLRHVTKWVSQLPEWTPDCRVRDYSAAGIILFPTGYHKTLIFDRGITKISFLICLECSSHRHVKWNHQHSIIQSQYQAIPQYMPAFQTHVSLTSTSTIFELLLKQQ
jgi:hypothetical protein